MKKQHSSNRASFLRNTAKFASILAIGFALSSCEKESEEPQSYNLLFRNTADPSIIVKDTIETIKITGTGLEAQMPVTLKQFAPEGEYYTIKNSAVENAKQLTLQFINNKGQLSYEKVLENPVGSDIKRVTYFLTIQLDLTLKTETQVVKR